MDRLKKILLYGNNDRKTFEKLYDEMTENNRRNLAVFTMIAAAGMLLMVFGSFLEPSLEKNRIMYLCTTIISFCLCIITRKCRKDQHFLIYTCIYIFEATLFYFGIALGTFIEPNEVSVSFPIMLFAVPLFFTDIPIRMCISIVIGIIAYTIAAHFTQTPTIFVYNMSNVVPYGAISIVVSTYMMLIKIRRLVLEHENRFLIETDQLTGMLNRRSYQQHLDLLKKNGCNPSILVCAFDVNSLKPVNDNIGHHAGDELLRGAANSIESVFGKYGRCYRVGGDEFAAILDGSYPSPEELKNALKKQCSCFHGAFVSGLSISIGMVSAKQTGIPNVSIDELIKQADQEMYADKKRYYEETAHDRRGKELHE